MKVLVIGGGGLGSPASLVLARSRPLSITVIDDDVVDASNLHRQVLYDDVDLGRDKAERAAARLAREGADARAVRGRFLPSAALELVRAHDLVIEGADNFATKFLAADACALAGVPLVSAGAVRWSGWALACVPGRSACLRCVFEDIPRDRVETCAEAGVIGPVVGAVGAVQAALALRILAGDTSAAGVLYAYRALEGRLRASRVRPRAGCPSCAGEITELVPERYAPPQCFV
ncbi:MAG TPA: HesA/MoeB/ThiF family protein [Sandaracinaceae bacterium]